jgi:hypothetical protein
MGTMGRCVSLSLFLRSNVEGVNVNVTLLLGVDDVCVNVICVLTPLDRRNCFGVVQSCLSLSA